MICSDLSTLDSPDLEEGGVGRLNLLVIHVSTKDSVALFIPVGRVRKNM
jgi:hypothetical protein